MLCSLMFGFFAIKRAYRLFKSLGSVHIIWTMSNVGGPQRVNRVLGLNCLTFATWPSFIMRLSITSQNTHDILTCMRLLIPISSLFPIFPKLRKDERWSSWFILLDSSLCFLSLNVLCLAAKSTKICWNLKQLNLKTENF